MTKASAPPSTANNDRPPTRMSFPSAERQANPAFENFLLDTALSWRDEGFCEQELARLLVLDLLVRTRTMFGRIDERFGGQPFILTLAPDAPANQHRLNCYLDDYGRATKLLKLAIELASITSTMKVTTVSTSQPKKWTKPVTECQAGNLISNAPSEGSKKKNVASRDGGEARKGGGPRKNKSNK